MGGREWGEVDVVANGTASSASHAVWVREGLTGGGGEGLRESGGEGLKRSLPYEPERRRRGGPKRRSRGWPMGRWRGGTEAKSAVRARSEEHTTELQSPSFISYAVFCYKKKKRLNSSHRE